MTPARIFKQLWTNTKNFFLFYGCQYKGKDHAHQKTDSWCDLVSRGKLKSPGIKINIFNVSTFANHSLASYMKRNKSPVLNLFYTIKKIRPGGVGSLRRVDITELLYSRYINLFSILQFSVLLCFVFSNYHIIKYLMEPSKENPFL